MLYVGSSVDVTIGVAALCHLCIKLDWRRADRTLEGMEKELPRRLSRTYSRRSSFFTSLGQGFSHIFAVIKQHGCLKKSGILHAVQTFLFQTTN